MNSIHRRVVTDIELAEAQADDPDEHPYPSSVVLDERYGRAVYLIEGRQLAYGYKVAWDLV